MFEIANNLFEFVGKLKKKKGQTVKASDFYRNIII